MTPAKPMTVDEAIKIGQKAASNGGCGGTTSSQDDDAAAVLAKLRNELPRIIRGIEAVRSLVNESHGVCGLHHNGDEAPWNELLRGGRFDWLYDFCEAEDALARLSPPAQEDLDEALKEG